jgi:uncharacterized protein with GYD domain
LARDAGRANALDGRRRVRAGPEIGQKIVEGDPRPGYRGARPVRVAIEGLVDRGNPVSPLQARSLMATYMSLINWTDQGIRSVKESPKRLDSTRKALKKMGGELRAYYMLQGHYDGVLIFDVPNEAALTKFLLLTGAAGNVRTTTLRAFPEEDFIKHIAAL